MTDKQDLARDGTLDGTRPIASGQAAVDGADADAGAAPDFLADLARAMQAAASAQRKHIADVAEQRKKAHIDAVHKRETTENEELREVSSRDVKGIEAWATAEIERIRLERQRRIAARKTELEEQLEQHHSMIETEIGAVEAAVVAYHQEVDRFFARLDLQADPIAIAETARNLPTFPALETIGRHNGASSSMNGSGAHPDEQPVIEEAPTAVDLPDAAPQRAAEPATEPPPSEDTETEPSAAAVASDDDVASGEPVAAGQPDTATPGQAPEQAPLVAAAKSRAPSPIAAVVTPWEGPGEATDPSADEGDTGIGTGPKVTPRSSGAVIQSVPSLRPIGSWLRRGNNSNSDESPD
jgi:hypothetical protein